MSTKQFKILRGAGALIVAGLVSGQVMAAGNTSSAEAEVSVTLYEPLVITAVDALRFGKVARNAPTGGGSIVIPTAGNVTNTGVTKVGDSAQAPATFTVTGTSGTTFGIAVGSITQPGTGFTISDVTLLGTGGVVFSSSASGASTTVFDGDAGITLGATLTIAPEAVASATENAIGRIPVTVTYE